MRSKEPEKVPLVTLDFVTPTVVIVQDIEEERNLRS